MTPELIILCVSIYFVLCFILLGVIYYAFKIINKEQSKTVQVIYNKDEKPKTEVTKENKSTVYSQKNDIDAVMSGKIVDPFD